MRVRLSHKLLRNGNHVSVRKKLFNVGCNVVVNYSTLAVDLARNAVGKGVARLCHKKDGNAVGLALHKVVRGANHAVIVHVYPHNALDNVVAFNVGINLSVVCTVRQGGIMIRVNLSLRLDDRERNAVHHVCRKGGGSGN